MKIEIAEALFYLGRLPGETIPAVAIQALMDGLDSDTLVELAGLHKSETQEIQNLFKRALNELGRKPLSKLEAARQYARHVSGQILSGELSPYEGARELWSVALVVGDDFHEFDPFIYAASEYEERPDDRSQFAFEIVEEAKRWVLTWPEGRPGLGEGQGGRPGERH